MIKTSIAILTVFLFLPMTHAHLKRQAPQFLVSYERGPNWKKNKEYKNQPDIGQHIQFLKDIYHKGEILLAGSKNPHENKILIIEAPDKNKLLSKLNQDPTLKKGVLKIKIEPFTTTMLRKNSHPHKHPEKQKEVGLSSTTPKK